MTCGWENKLCVVYNRGEILVGFGLGFGLGVCVWFGLRVNLDLPKDLGQIMIKFCPGFGLILNSFVQYI